MGKKKGNCMNFLDIIHIYFSINNYNYDKNADIVLKNLMDKGTITTLSTHLDYDGIPHAIYIQYKDSIYEVWIANRFYADFSKVYKYEYMYEDGKYKITYKDRILVYESIRPSRLMKIKFWNWILDKYPLLLEGKDSINTEVINNM